MKTETAKTQASGYEVPPLCVRQLETRTLLALDRIERLETRPHLTRDRNARGYAHTKLRYRLHNGGWQSFYLGNPNTNDELQLRARIKGRWPLSRRELSRTTRNLQAQRTRAREHAQALAAGCGYSFRGWMIHRQPRIKK
ncbi:MAG: hypothetical protein WCK89_14850 [bacterium]